MTKLLVILTCWRFVPHYLFYLFAGDRELVRQDLQRNSRLFLRCEPGFYAFCRLMTFFRMFRNIFYARVAHRHKLLSKVLALLASPQPLLDVSSTADIGGGLIVQHGYGTIIAPRRIGCNCWVNQGVTIGYTNDTDCPTIGDNVTIYAGAKVLGDVHVGDNAVVAANAVVVKDVPANAIVGGVPARVIKMKDASISVGTRLSHIGQT